VAIVDIILAFEIGRGKLSFSAKFAKIYNGPQKYVYLSIFVSLILKDLFFLKGHFKHNSNFISRV